MDPKASFSNYQLMANPISSITTPPFSLLPSCFKSNGIT